jgi:hypothetical protein
MYKRIGSRYEDYYHQVIQKLIATKSDHRIMNRLSEIFIYGDDSKRIEEYQKLLEDFNISVHDLFHSESEDKSDAGSDKTLDKNASENQGDNSNDSKKNEEQK